MKFCSLTKGMKHAVQLAEDSCHSSVPGVWSNVGLNQKNDTAKRATCVLEQNPDPLSSLLGLDPIL